MNYKDKETINRKRKEKILENEEYIKWLEEYVKNKNNFTSDSSNEENVESLESLYLVIEEYAEENYIYPVEDIFGYHYTISYNKNNYNIGYMTGPETFFYCEKTTNESMIEFKDILTRKNNIKTELLKYKLKTLELLINELMLVLPEETIKKETNKIILKRKNSKGRKYD